MEAFGRKGRPVLCPCFPNVSLSKTRNPVAPVSTRSPLIVTQFDVLPGAQISAVAKGTFW
jgi:hypothetical protein